MVKSLALSSVLAAEQKGNSVTCHFRRVRTLFSLVVIFPEYYWHCGMRSWYCLLYYQTQSWFSFYLCAFNHHRTSELECSLFPSFLHEMSMFSLLFAQLQLSDRSYDLNPHSQNYFSKIPLLSCVFHIYNSIFSLHMKKQVCSPGGGTTDKVFNSQVWGSKFHH